MAFATKGALHELKRRKEKELAIKYYEENDVPKEIEKILNIMAVERPVDAYGCMVDYFRSLAQPAVISFLRASVTYDSCFGTAVAIELFCVVNGKKKLVSVFSTSLQQICKSVASLEANEDSMPDTVASVNSHCTDKLLKEFTSVLKGEETTNQKELDDKISNVAVVSHGESFGVSSVCASAAASLQNISTIQHLATVYRNEGDRLSLPYLVCPILCSGIYGIGKLKIGQFCITPLPAVCFTEQVTYLKSFHNQLLVVLRNKFGASSCAATNQGHCVPLDKVEQPFDLISDTANACGLELGKHIGIIVCVNGSELYNAEKEKYEIVSGQLKTADEMVTQVENMVCSRDGVVGVVNPFIPKDTEAWQKLHSLIGQRCYIMTDCAELFENGTEVVSANCAILRPATTITQTVANCSCYEARGHAVMMSLVGPTTTSMLEMLADLVVVSGCRFVKIPHFKDMASVYISHLLNTRLALVSADMYDICKAHNYSTKDSRDGECSS